jgi:subtilisin family serine protease
MTKLNTMIIGMVTSFQMLISSLFPSTLSGSNQVEQVSAFNSAQINVQLSKQAIGNSKVRRIVELSNDSEAQKFAASMTGVQIIQLGSGRYIVIGTGMTQSQLDKQLSRRRDVKRIDAPKTIKIIKPIQKTNPRQITAPQNSLTANAVNDPGYKYEWYLGATGVDKSWSLIKQQREIKVAVLDTGIDYTHPDLKNKILTNLGYNFISGTQDATDDNGHGTHVSGIIAAEANNKQGITGVTGSLDVKIIPVKVLDSNGEGTSDVIAKGIRYAADNGADIINMSFDASEKDVDIDSAIQYAKSKGVFMVAAAGNSSSSCDADTPASDSGVFTVSAINSNMRVASFSNYGSSVQAASPGVSILSTIPGGKYQEWDGTSMAAPVVSGIAAILKAEDPTLTPDSIASLLDSTTAQSLSGKTRNIYSGYGLVNAYNAVKKLEGIK